MNIFYKADLSFETLASDESGHLQVSEDQTLYSVKSARKQME
jgi:hypothetical protein